VKISRTVKGGRKEDVVALAEGKDVVCKES
jgi:hypothetical protein